jgi:hypothetical protein
MSARKPLIVLLCTQGIGVQWMKSRGVDPTKTPIKVVSQPMQIKGLHLDWETDRVIEVGPQCDPGVRREMERRFPREWIEWQPMHEVDPAEERARKMALDFKMALERQMQNLSKDLSSLSIEMRRWMGEELS